MILTLAANPNARKIKGNGGAEASLLDIPAMTTETLLLRGLNLFASSLAGWSIEDLDRLRDRADKAGCPCLVLIDDAPLDFWTDAKIPASINRVKRLAAAANRLGCNSLAVKCEAPDTEEAFELTAMTLREAMGPAERLELNILLAPNQGLTDSPDRLTDLIKRIGGFRIGSLPSFGYAAQTGDQINALRKLAPYAGGVHATVGDFTKSGKHKGYDLASCVHAIRAVGFTNTLAIEYVGEDDPVVAIKHARDILLAAIEGDQE